MRPLQYSTHDQQLGANLGNADQSIQILGRKASGFRSAMRR